MFHQYLLGSLACDVEHILEYWMKFGKGKWYTFLKIKSRNKFLWIWIIIILFVLNFKWFKLLKIQYLSTGRNDPSIQSPPILNLIVFDLVIQTFVSIFASQIPKELFIWMRLKRQTNHIHVIHFQMMNTFERKS